MKALCATQTVEECGTDPWLFRKKSSEMVLVLLSIRQCLHDISVDFPESGWVLFCGRGNGDTHRSVVRPCNGNYG